MKRYFYSLALALCALMLAMPVKAKQEIIHVNHFNEVRLYLEDSSHDDVVVTLDADLEIDDKWYSAEDISLAHSARILRVDNNAPEKYWRNKGLEKYCIAYRYGYEKIAAFVSIGLGKKTLDLNGHSITAAFDEAATFRALHHYDEGFFVYKSCALFEWLRHVDSNLRLRL